MKRTSLLTIALLCWLTVGAAHAETRNVPSAEYQTIQSAITASENGDVVVVSPGIYFERISFEGKDITVTSTDPDDSRVVGYTVLNGEGGGTVVLFPGGETAAAVLAGFTITRGYGTLNAELTEGTERLYMGAGVYCDRSSPTITKNIIVRNEGPLEIIADYSQVNISYGGGIGAWYGSPTITYNTIRNNSGYIGGGVICFYGAPTIHNNVIFENSAYLGGGLIAFAGDIYNNTFVRNDCDFGAESGIAGLGTGMGGNMYMVFASEFGAARVFNNIMAEAPSGGGLFWEGDVDSAAVAYNNLWDNVPDNYGYMDPDTYTEVFGAGGDLTGQMGNISQDPLFLASISKNFHLTLDSPCINAGDPEFVPAAGQTDIDGEDRIYAARIDMGADEYVGYVKPVADAGWDVHVLEPLEMVTLDGRDSFFYDPADIQTYQWTQVSGPDTVLDAADSTMPTFSPPEAGEYVFELVVADSQYSSTPDQVLVFVGPNRGPTADAGPDKAYLTPGQVALDGTGSYDPDPVDHLSYSWTQLEGPVVTLDEADTATPTFAGEPGSVYVFELVVSDGFEESPPSQVRVVTVGGDIDVSALDIEAIEDRYPHYVDVSGSRAVFAADSLSGYSWQIGCSDFRMNLTETFGTGFNTQPQIEGDLVVWAGDVRFTSNVLAPQCASILARDLETEETVTLRAKSDTESYSHPAISGHRVVWVQHQNIDKNTSAQWRNMPYDICGADITDLNAPTYFTVATGVGQRDPLPIDNIYEDYDDVVAIDGDLVVWEGDGDIYAADLSDLNAIRIFTVCDHEARQYDPAVSGSYVVWTDERNDEADIYGADLSDPEAVRVFAVVKASGEQRQPTIENGLVSYVQGNTSGGQIGLACITARYGVMDIGVTDGLYGLAPAFDGTTLIWLNSTYGPVQGGRVAFGYSAFDGAIENVTTGQRYDYIQHAISDAAAGGVITVPAGVYREEINFAGKAVTVRSTDPADPAVVAATILEGNGDLVTCAEAETAESVLDGLTLAGGGRGIFLSGGSPTIKRCTIASNNRAGVFLINQSEPTFTLCRVVGNGGAGLEAWVSSDRRASRPCAMTLSNCIVAGNRAIGIDGGRLVLDRSTVVGNLGVGIAAITPTISNSIVYFNDRDGAGVQIDDTRATVTYSDIEGGWSGDGNLDADPLFVSPGQWADGAWLEGDYHLQSQGRRWDRQTGQWASDEATSPCIDAGDPAASLLEEPVDVAGEPAVTNERINMGAYGGTSEASLAPAGD